MKIKKIMETPCIQIKISTYTSGTWETVLSVLVDNILILRQLDNVAVGKKPT
jgi:hypothetical protein